MSRIYKNNLGNPFVDSYWIEELDHGMVKLVLNLIEKQTACSRVSDDQFYISENDEIEGYYPLTIPDLPSKGFTCLEQRAGWQISYFYIPTYQLIGENNNIKDHYKRKYDEVTSNSNRK